MGYARDFVGAMDSVHEGRRRARRAGHRECGRRESDRRAREAIREVAKKRGVADKVKIGVVTGDDLLPRLDELHRAGPCARQHGDRRAAVHRARPRALGERLHRLDADRRSARRATRTSSSPAARPTPRSPWRRSATSSAGAPRTGTSSPRASSPATSSNAARSARAATVSTTGSNIPDLANIGYPIVEAKADGTFVDRQASEHRRPHQRAVGHRAVRVRDGRSELVHHARRRRRLHDDPSRAGRRRTA